MGSTLRWRERIVHGQASVYRRKESGNGPPKDEKSLKRLFDEYSSDVSYKQKYMDSNAFVVYYTKGFDGKDRPNIEDDPATERLRRRAPR